jgi:hypothetical protein
MDIKKGRILRKEGKKEEREEGRKEGISKEGY